MIWDLFILNDKPYSTGRYITLDLNAVGNSY